MSKKYIPLYTKYRPMVFADLTGQESTVKALSNAVESGRIMHAYLFCGPRGTGKTSSARIFAKSLNCVNGPTVSPCGQCPGCLDVINSTPVDVIEIDAASNRSVEDARNILEKVQYAPLHGKYKIYIIDEVHMLTTEASNTLLKTLEEPPENVIFILATTESHKVLETIVSRCQRYDFRRITTADIVKRLEFIAKSENIKINKEALLAIAKNASGGMRDAVALLDQLSVLGQNRAITVEDVNEILGQISYDKIFELAECIIQSSTEAALKILNDIHDRGNEPGRVLTALLQYFRDLLILKSCSDNDIVLSMTRINEEIIDKLKVQAENFDAKTLIYFADRISYYFTKLKETTNKYMWAELCIIELINSPKILSIEELSQKIAVLESKINSGDFTQTSGVKPAFNPQPISVSPKKIEITPPLNQFVSEETPETHVSEQKIQKTGVSKDDWAKITAIIKPPAGIFFSNLAKPLEINSTKIVIGFSNESAVKQANDTNKKSLLEAAAKEYYGVSDIIIEIKLGADKKKNNSVKPLLPENEPPVMHQDKKIIPTPKQRQDISSETPVDSSNLDEIEECIVKKEAEIVNILDASDTAKHIIQLFDGKISNS